MGVDYGVYVGYGFTIDKQSTKSILSPAIYKDEPRYNTKTGKVSHTKKVLVKDEVIQYKYKDIVSDDFVELIDKICKHYNLTYAVNSDYNFAGIGFILESEDYGRLTVSVQSIDLTTIQEYNKILLDKGIDQNDLLLFTIINIG